jgi:tRNA threonylcarbamoyladenosine biosynthesis protein TsaB
MRRILSLETSTSVCSVALHQEGNLKFVSEIHEDQAHAGKLSPLIEHALNLLGWEADSLDAVAVSGGPGSYTGLRIGTSTAKGLCLALNIPLIAVDSLKVMASYVTKLNVSDGHLCPMLDARRMEVYCSLYTSQLDTVSPVQALVIEPGAFEEILAKDKVCFFGPGAEKCLGVIAHPNASFIHGIYPSARDLGELATASFDRGEFQDLMAFEPLYLKEFLVKKSTKLERVLNK